MKWLTVFLAAITLSATTHAAERVLFFSPIMGKPKYAAAAGALRQSGRLPPSRLFTHRSHAA